MMLTEAMATFLMAQRTMPGEYGGGNSVNAWDCFSYDRLHTYVHHSKLTI